MFSLRTVICREGEIFARRWPIKEATGTNINQWEIWGTGKYEELYAVTFCPQVCGSIRTAVLFFLIAKNVWRKQKDFLGFRLGNFPLVKVIGILSITGGKSCGKVTAIRQRSLCPLLRPGQTSCFSIHHFLCLIFELNKGYEGKPADSQPKGRFFLYVLLPEWSEEGASLKPNLLNFRDHGEVFEMEEVLIAWQMSVIILHCWWLRLL